jgi:hypothetical protein
MAGEFEVQFRFEETVALRDGYTIVSPKRSGGTELVLVVEDSPKRIVLQHILVMPPSAAKSDAAATAVEPVPEPIVVKHWRQDWTFEKRSALEFRGDRVWERRGLSRRDVRGTWMQEVFEVDESPRYASMGRWVHRGGTSTWTSGETWRPLPRREHTTRSDYDVLTGVNRHIITPGGWVHEQDNVKLDLRRNAAEPMIVKEFGLNRYRRIADHDFEPGRAYWQRTSAFWASVRAAWAERLGAARRARIELDTDGRPVMERLFELAACTGPLAERAGQARSVIDRSVVPEPDERRLQAAAR